MRYKFEVTNGASSIDDIALLGRMQSYMITLGNIPQI